MKKRFLAKVLGRKQTIVIDKVDALEEFRKSVVEERLYGRPYYKPLFSEMGRRGMIQSGQKYMKIEISARLADGTVLSRTYDIPIYCAHGIKDKMKKLEGREIKLRLHGRLPRKLPYRSF